MSLLPEVDELQSRDNRQRTYAATDDLISSLFRKNCRQFPSPGQHEKVAQIERLIRSKAWTDAALALIDLELPLWHVRRIIYDDGEWYCALSRQREFPDWLDRSIEAHHADLPLAILSACIDAQHISEPADLTGSVIVPRDANALCEPVCCDNFG